MLSVVKNAGQFAGLKMSQVLLCLSTSLIASNFAIIADGTKPHDKSLEIFAKHHSTVHVPKGQESILQCMQMAREAQFKASGSRKEGREEETEAVCRGCLQTGPSSDRPQGGRTEREVTICTANILLHFVMKGCVTKGHALSLSWMLTSIIYRSRHFYPTEMSLLPAWAAGPKGKI